MKAAWGDAGSPRSCLCPRPVRAEGCGDSEGTVRKKHLDLLARPAGASAHSSGLSPRRSPVSRSAVLLRATNTCSSSRMLVVKAGLHRSQRFRATFRPLTSWGRGPVWKARCREDRSLSVRFSPLRFRSFSGDWSSHHVLSKSQDADDFPATDIFSGSTSGTTSVPETSRF